MDILFKGSVAKYFDNPEDNEDVYHTVAERNRVVLCDGASESFDAKTWASLLSSAFAKDEPSIAVITSCIESFEERHDPANMAWSKAAAFERGSYATALVVQDDPIAMSVSLSCIGDSFAALTDGAVLIETLPYRLSTEFEGKPTLLSTIRSHNNQLQLEGELITTYTSWSYAERQPLFLLCMTDALGAWLLRCQEEHDHYALERLMGIRDESELHDLVEAERSTGRMRRDDTTLVIALL